MQNTSHKYEPEELLVHRAPMQLLSSVDSWGEDWIECLAKHDVGAPFADCYGRRPAWVGLEYMCQAICALEGIGLVLEGQAPAPAFLLGTRKFESSCSYLEPNEPVRIRVDTELRDNTRLGVFQCEIYDQERKLMSAKIKGIMVKDPKTILLRNK